MSSPVKAPVDKLQNDSYASAVRDLTYISASEYVHNV